MMKGITICSNLLIAVSYTVGKKCMLTSALSPGVNGQVGMFECLMITTVSKQPSWNVNSKHYVKEGSMCNFCGWIIIVHIGNG